MFIQPLNGINDVIDGKTDWKCKMPGNRPDWHEFRAYLSRPASPLPPCPLTAPPAVRMPLDNSLFQDFKLLVIRNVGMTKHIKEGDAGY